MLTNPEVVTQRNYRTVFNQLGKDQRKSADIYEMPEWMEAAIDTYLTDYHAQAPMDTRERLLVRIRYAAGSHERDRGAFVRTLRPLISALAILVTGLAAAINLWSLVPQWVTEFILTLTLASVAYCFVIMFYERVGPTQASLVTELVDVLMTDRLERTRNGRPH